MSRAAFELAALGLVAVSGLASYGASIVVLIAHNL